MKTLTLQLSLTAPLCFAVICMGCSQSPSSEPQKNPDDLMSKAENVFSKDNLQEPIRYILPYKISENGKSGFVSHQEQKTLITVPPGRSGIVRISLGQPNSDEEINMTFSNGHLIATQQPRGNRLTLYLRSDGGYLHAVGKRWTVGSEDHRRYDRVENGTLVQGEPTKVKASSKSEVCFNNLMMMSIAMRNFQIDNGDAYPSGEKWSDQLLPYLGYAKNAFRCPAAPELDCAYSLNRNVVGKYISPNTVVVFESVGGWNSTHGAESVAFRHGEKNGRKLGSFLFGDGHVEGLAHPQHEWKARD